MRRAISGARWNRKVPGISAFVLLDLVERLAGLVFVRERALALDHDQRNAVDVDDQVGPSCGLRSDGQLFGDDEEVDQLDRLLLGLAGDAAAVVAPEDTGPALIVLDAEQLVVGSAGNVFRDLVQPLDRCGPWDTRPPGGEKSGVRTLKKPRRQRQSPD